MKKVAIKLDPRDSNYVEKLHFEYNAALNIIAFLMSRDEVKIEHLQKYLDASEQKYMRLEIAKDEINKKYKPDDFSMNYNYSFDFAAEELIYSEVLNG